MLHLLLFLVCILSVEIFIRSNFIDSLSLLSNVLKKALHVIPARNISDHWKERVALAYALRIMKCCVQLLLIILTLISLLLIGDYYLNNFLEFTFSFLGIVNSIVFTCGYVFLRKSLIK